MGLQVYSGYSYSVEAPPHLMYPPVPCRAVPPVIIAVSKCTHPQIPTVTPYNRADISTATWAWRESGIVFRMTSTCIVIMSPESSAATIGSVLHGPTKKEAYRT